MCIAMATASLRESTFSISIGPYIAYMAMLMKCQSHLYLQPATQRLCRGHLPVGVGTLVDERNVGAMYSGCHLIGAMYSYWNTSNRVPCGNSMTNFNVIPN